MDSFITASNIFILKGVWHEIFVFRFSFTNQFPPALFWIFMKIRGIIRNFVFIAGVLDKLIIVPT